MSATSRLYIFVFFVWVVSILVVLMGFDKTVKMIIGNYIITILVLAVGGIIDFSVNYINEHAVEFLGMGPAEYANLLQDARLTISLVLYITLMVVRYRFSSFTVSLSSTEETNKGYLLITTPLCVIGTILSLLIIILWTRYADISRMTKTIPDNPEIRNIIMRIPLRIALHCSVFIALTIKIKRKTVTQFSSEYE